MSNAIYDPIALDNPDMGDSKRVLAESIRREARLSKYYRAKAIQHARLALYHDGQAATHKKDMLIAMELSDDCSDHRKAKIELYRSSYGGANG